MWCMMLIQVVILLCCCSSWQWWWSAQPPDHHHCQLEQPQRSSITSSNIMGHIHIDRWLHAADTLRAFSFHFTVTGEQGGISVECQATKQGRHKREEIYGHKRANFAVTGEAAPVRDRQGASGIVRDLQPLSRQGSSGIFSRNWTTTVSYTVFESSLLSRLPFPPVSEPNAGFREDRPFSRKPPVFEKIINFYQNHRYSSQTPVFEKTARFRENCRVFAKTRRFRVFAPKPATSPWPRHTFRLHCSLGGNEGRPLEVRP